MTVREKELAGTEPAIDDAKLNAFLAKVLDDWGAVSSAPLVMIGPLVVAGTAYVARPWGSSEGWAGELAWPQLCCVVALSGVCALAALEATRPRRRAARRMKGLSTKR